jgi:hypothetical protein
MFATKMHKMAFRSAIRNPLVNRYVSKTANATPSLCIAWQQPTRAFSSQVVPDASAASKATSQAHAFSSMAAALPRGTLEKPLQVLDMAIVRKIKAELMEVDANSDGRYATSSNDWSYTQTSFRSCACS